MLFATTLLCSCSPENGEITQLGLGFDASASLLANTKGNFINKDEVYNFIWNEIKLDTIGFENDGAIIHFTFLGWASVPEITTVKLAPKQGHWLFNNRLERHKEIKLFQDDLKNAIDRLSQTKANQKYTHIYRPTINLINQLEPKSKTTKLFLLSDFIGDNELINLNRYKNNPSKIIEQDFEKLSKTVLEDSSFPKEIAENLEIILIHKTDEKNDMLSTYCARFYKKIFENKIKTVKQRASL